MEFLSSDDFQFFLDELLSVLLSDSDCFPFDLIIADIDDRNQSRKSKIDNNKVSIK